MSGSGNAGTLAVNLHVNSATFKADLIDAYQTGVREARRFSDSTGKALKDTGDSIERTGGKVGGLGNAFNGLTSRLGVSHSGFEQLRSALNGFAATGHVSANALANALVPAISKTLAGSDRLGNTLKKQREEFSQNAQSAYSEARAQIQSALAAKQKAQEVAKGAAKDYEAAKAAEENAVALARYYEQQQKVNREYGLAVSYKEEYRKINTQLKESDMAAAVAKKRIAAAARSVAEAEAVEAAGKTKLAAAMSLISARNYEISTSARVAAAGARLLSGALAMVGGPVGLAVIALVSGMTALWSAYDKAEQKTKALNGAMLESSNGMTLNLTRLRQLNNSLGDTDGSMKAVTAAVKAGFTGDMLDRVAALGSRMEELGGSADDLVRQLSSISGDPVKAMQAATQQGYEFNVAQIEQIATLARQGKTAEAVALVQKVVLDDVSIRLKNQQRDVEENVGWWGKLKEVVSEGFAAYGNAQIATAKAQAAAVGVDMDKIAADLQAKRDIQKKEENARADALRKQQDEQTKRITKETEFNALVKAGADKTKLAADATADATARYKAGKISADEYAAALRGINKLYGDHKKPAEYHDSEGVRRLAQLQQQAVVLKAQGQETEKMTESQKKLLAFDQEIASYAGKKLTKEQQSVLSMQDQIRAQLQLNAGLEQQNQQQKLSVTLSRQLQDVRDETASRAQEQANTQAQMTMSNAAYSQMVAEQQIRESFASRQKELDREVADHASLLYQMQTQNLQDEMDKQIAIVRRGAEDKKRAEEDYTAGLKKGAEDWIAENGNAYDQMRQFATRSFDSMADSLANFALTGKLNFRGLASSILADLAKMEARIAASKALGMLLNWGMSAIGGGAGAAAGSTGTAIQSYGANFQLNANGGVYSSPDLSAYSNSVVRNPTPFMFAKGAGLMGEAGPEAILPLTRNSRGQLSVHTTGGNGGGVVINQNFNFSVNGDPETGMPDRGELAGMAGMFKQLVRDVISEESRDGGMLSGAH